MRRRELSPGFFTSRQMLGCPPLARILFAGLWCTADREGRLRDDPWRFKLEILPGDDADVDAFLDALAAAVGADGLPLIVRYRVGDTGYIAIPKFADHQHPHIREAASRIPAPPVSKGDAQHVPRHDLGDVKHVPRHDLGSVKPGGLSGLTGLQTHRRRARARGSAGEDDPEPRHLAVTVYAATLEACGLSPPTAAEAGVIDRRAALLLDGGKDVRDVLAACRTAAQTGQAGLLDRYCGEAERDRLRVPRSDRAAHQDPAPPRPPRAPVLAPADPTVIAAGLDAFHAEQARLAAERQPNGTATHARAGEGDANGKPGADPTAHPTAAVSANVTVDSATAPEQRPSTSRGG